MWLSSLDDTKWLHLVAKCLSTGNHVAKSVSNEFRRNIVIKGKNDFGSIRASFCENQECGLRTGPTIYQAVQAQMARGWKF